MSELRRSAPIFSALGDETRLTLLLKLGRGTPLSITRLSRDAKMSRQAITKHLRVLQEAGLVSGLRRGRETLFRIQSDPLAEARRALDVISGQWDEALARLQAFVEEPVGISPHT